jgi:two-component system KDP operon response regulator KdpE
VENTTLTRVLVIGEDRATVGMLKQILEPREFEVIESHSSSAEGIASAHQFNPDVVVLDMLLPEINGWQICKKIRSFSKVPILVLSAADRPGMIANALNEGADGFLLRPMPSNVLIAHINRLARRARAEKAANNSDCTSGRPGLKLA